MLYSCRQWLRSSLTHSNYPKKRPCRFTKSKTREEALAWFKQRSSIIRPGRKGTVYWWKVKIAASTARAWQSWTFWRKECTTWPEDVLSAPKSSICKRSRVRRREWICCKTRSSSSKTDLITLSWRRSSKVKWESKTTDPRRILTSLTSTQRPKMSSKTYLMSSINSNSTQTEPAWMSSDSRSAKSLKGSFSIRIGLQDLQVRCNLRSKSMHSDATPTTPCRVKLLRLNQCLCIIANSCKIRAKQRIRIP